MGLKGERRPCCVGAPPPLTPAGAPAPTIRGPISGTVCVSPENPVSARPGPLPSLSPELPVRPGAGAPADGRGTASGRVASATSCSWRTHDAGSLGRGCARLCVAPDESMASSMCHAPSCCVTRGGRVRTGRERAPCSAGRATRVPPHGAQGRAPECDRNHKCFPVVGSLRVAATWPAAANPKHVPHGPAHPGACTKEKGFSGRLTAPRKPVAFWVLTPSCHCPKPPRRSPGGGSFRPCPRAPWGGPPGLGASPASQPRRTTAGSRATSDVRRQAPNRGHPGGTKVCRRPTRLVCCQTLVSCRDVWEGDLTGDRGFRVV